MDYWADYRAVQQWQVFLQGDSRQIARLTNDIQVVLQLLQPHSKPTSLELSKLVADIDRKMQELGAIENDKK